MVTVSNYVVRERKDGTTFITLELTGGVELIQSSTSGSFYATVRKCSIPATFDETTAQALVGTQITGDVVRVQTEPYEYLNKRTGEMVMLSHAYAYRPEGATELVGNSTAEEIQGV